MPSSRRIRAPRVVFSLLFTGLLASACAWAAPQAAAPVASGIGAPAPSGVYYEIFVRSFYDSDGNGIGDLDGVTAKLPYLKSLGVSGIWLMPIFPSPSYHGYDITDYRAINPQYGSMADFERLVKAAHADGIKVILDMVINHTSDQNPWFIAARNPASTYHDWYIWAGPHTNLKEKSPWGGPVWRTLGKQHYMGIFCRCMPDLNYDNPAVRHAMISIGRFWLRKGADGFRLDAAKHIFDKLQQDDHSMAIMREDAAWWSEYRSGLDKVDPHAYLVGEVTGSHYRLDAPFVKPLNAVFDFPLAVRLVKSASSGRDDGIGDALVHMQTVYRAAAGHYVMDAPFLSNHDQQRVMTDLRGNLEHMKVAAALLLTLPGNPYVYYGEEIGMRGTKPDPQDREPMRWDISRTAPGETTWEVSPVPMREDVSVQAEKNNPHSLLGRYRELIHWRMDIAPLRDGVAGEYATGNPALAAWRLRDHAGGVLVVHNLSGQPQHLRLRSVGGLHYATLLRSTSAQAIIDGSVLKLPAYSSAVLDGTPVTADTHSRRTP
ncbi:MAG: alpha-amylase family glycosyl hydrolase [Metallibacterium sp.]